MQTKPYLREVSLRHDILPSTEEYPFDISAIKNLDVLKFHSDVTFFVGENGSGKSTLLEAIALSVGFSPEGGTKNTLFQTAETVSQLHRYIKTAKSFRTPKDHYFLRAESFYNVATYVDELRDFGVISSYGGRSLHQCSHGEAFMALLTAKFRGNGLYLLDEPEAALSPSRQLAALSAIHQLVKEESQFIIATHSPILLAYPHAKIVLFDSSGLSEIQYEDTEHFAITRNFLNHYPHRLKTLLDE
ncbi:AAA family ATPase [Undibacterium luofuense]|uniref:AAA family ATPase n=1 Tax=Undibacterium luofuense TaxID=2828733 RepID=A0A941DJF8_9BURK|nr:AAA family ATPase [Undibacterium luofuense]MBR7781878.1 AAA family ATPase [Undibacterium luofuense]